MKIHLIQMKIDELLTVCDEHNNDPGELINILHAAQGIFGYLPREVQEIIAGRLHIPVSKVYGVVTFYSFFTMTPKGKYPVSVCLGTACYVRGAEKVLEEFQRRVETQSAGRDYIRRPAFWAGLFHVVWGLADWLRSSRLPEKFMDV